MLEIDNIWAGYGDTTVLSGVSLSVDAGEAVALLGRNGMGKTTCLLAIMGLNPARRGEIRFQGQPITTLPSYDIARLGIGYSPEGRRLFAPLTVLQNLRIPFVNKHPDQSQWPAQLEAVYALFPILKERSRQKAGSLSGGEQQMVAIARTMIGGDKLLVLDEPTEGLAPMVIDMIIAAIRRLKALGKTVLLVEQNAARAFEVADRAYILEKGRIVASGITTELAADRRMLDRYLGIPEQRQPA